MAQQETMTDGQMLDILDRVERQGQTMAQAGARYGLSRSAVAGCLKRVRDALAQSEAVAPKRGELLAYWPENKNGGMPARWWEAGLRARADAARKYPAQRRRA